VAIKPGSKFNKPAFAAACGRTTLDLVRDGEWPYVTLNVVGSNVLSLPATCGGWVCGPRDNAPVMLVAARCSKKQVKSCNSKPTLKFDETGKILEEEKE
jgi:hypothetical protein